MRPRNLAFDEARRVRPPRAVLRAHYQLLGLEEGANASEAREGKFLLVLQVGNEGMIHIHYE